MSYVIASATRNKIVLSVKKEQFLYLKYDAGYSKVNAFNMALLSKVAYMEDGDIKKFLFDCTENEKRKFSFKGVRNVESAFLYDTDEAVSEIKSTYLFENVNETNSQFFY